MSHSDPIYVKRVLATCISPSQSDSRRSTGISGLCDVGFRIIFCPSFSSCFSECPLVNKRNILTNNQISSRISSQVVGSQTESLDFNHLIGQSGRLQTRFSLNLHFSTNATYGTVFDETAIVLFVVYRCTRGFIVA